MSKENTSKETDNSTLRKTDVICCDAFKQNIKSYGLFKLEHLGEDEYLMPHIINTNIRMNYCPACGKECRNVVLSSDLYHSI